MGRPVFCFVHRIAGAVSALSAFCVSVHVQRRANRTVGQASVDDIPDVMSCWHWLSKLTRRHVRPRRRTLKEINGPVTVDSVSGLTKQLQVNWWLVFQTTFETVESIPYLVPNRVVSCVETHIAKE